MRKPKYRRHTSRDRGFVEMNGKRRYLPGKYKSPESLSAYRAIVLALSRFDEGPESKPLYVADIAERFIAWAIETYPPGGRSESANCRAAIGHLIRLDGGMSIAEYGPLRLRELQHRLARAKKSRTYINAVCARVKRMFKWAVAEELIPPAAYHAVAAAPGLRKGRSVALEPRPRLPVAWEHVTAVLPELSRTVRAMVLLQWFTGARSQSVCLARPEQFKTAATVWEWRPRHKTEHLDQDLILFVGPQAQVVLRPFLTDRKRGDFLFQPKHARTGKRARGYRSFYDSVSYLRAIARAQARVNAQRGQAGLEPIPHWTPHQLRHARATLVREAHGLEAAQATLGHSRMTTTEIYARKQLDLAKTVAMKMG